MKKNVIMGMVLVVSAVVFFGCASTAPVAVETVAPDYRIVDNKAMATGMSAAPKWYDAAMDSNTALKELYPDSIPVVQTGDGANLEAIKFELETFGANRELAGRLSTYVSSTAEQTINSDGNANIEKVLLSD